MSKAFTRELDDEEEMPLAPRPAAVLPPGAKNLITPGGALRLRNELDRIVQQERPRLASAAGDDAERKRQLKLLDQRAQQLEGILRTAVVTGPSMGSDREVRFGATVTVRDKEGEQSTYRIVGVDETDLDRDWISWLSPVAKALLNAHVGQRVRFKLPGGDQEFEILDVRYE
jgi:transcription elongation factor GreB